LVWAYSRGVVSSRRIERACSEDVVFRVICGNEAPDHSTIARFRQRHELVAQGLFVQVLALCAQAGLVSLETLAVDGTKMSANAALDANRDVEKLRERVQGFFDAAGEADRAEDDLFGEGHSGNGLPAELADPDKRAARIAELLGKVDGEEGGDRKRVNLTDDDSRIMPTAGGGFVQGYNAQAVCVEGQVVVAAAVTNDVSDFHQLHPMLDLVEANTAAAGIDDEVGITLADAGYFTATNVTDAAKAGRDVLIAPGTKRRDLPTTGSTHDPDAEAARWSEFGADQARIDADMAAERTRRAKIFERIDTTGGDIRTHLDELAVSQAVAYRGLRQWRDGGVDAVTVTTPKWQVPRPTKRTDAQAARDVMADRFAIEENKQLYKQRSHLIETLFARTKAIRGIRRFARRGLDAVTAEWVLISTVHNIGQLTRPS
jgi:IS5 family transposase